MHILHIFVGIILFQMGLLQIAIHYSSCSVAEYFPSIIFLLLWAGEFEGIIPESCIFIIFFINRTVFVLAKCMLWTSELSVYLSIDLPRGFIIFAEPCNSNSLPPSSGGEDSARRLLSALLQTRHLALACFQSKAVASNINDKWETGRVIEQEHFITTLTHFH